MSGELNWRSGKQLVSWDEFTPRASAFTDHDDIKILSSYQLNLSSWSSPMFVGFTGTVLLLAPELTNWTRLGANFRSLSIKILLFQQHCLLNNKVAVNDLLVSVACCMCWSGGKRNSALTVRPMIQHTYVETTLMIITSASMLTVIITSGKKPRQLYCESTMRPASSSYFHSWRAHIAASPAYNTKRDYSLSWCYWGSRLPSLGFGLRPLYCDGRLYHVDGCTGLKVSSSASMPTDFRRLLLHVHSTCWMDIVPVSAYKISTSLQLMQPLAEWLNPRGRTARSLHQASDITARCVPQVGSWAENCCQQVRITATNQI